MYLKLLFCLFAIGFAVGAEIAGIDPGKFMEYFRNHVGNHVINRSGEKVDIRLYYEAWCGGCIQFHTHTLNKTVIELGDYIDLKTYPYGNAVKREENGKTVIECQHGPGECHGNKLHACALDILEDTKQSVFYINCMMSGMPRGSTDKDAIKCGEQMGINAKQIIECAKGEKGEKLLEYYGEETDKDVPDRKGVPWSLINGKYVQGGDYDQWKAAICAAMAHPPPQCNQL